MKFSLSARQICLAVFTFLVSGMSAQTRLIVNGAKINMDTAVVLSTNNLTVNSGSITVPLDSKLKIAGNVTGNKIIDAADGTVEMNGKAGQQVSNSVFRSNLVKNMTINSAGNVAFADSVHITDVLTLSNGSVNGNGYLSLLSTANKTARVAPVTTSASTPATGIVVERYIPAKRAYRFITAPVNTTGNIKANWMENVMSTSYANNLNPKPGYGTHITGTGGTSNGFDFTATNNASLYIYDNSGQAWGKVNNTNGTMSAGQAFRLLVRGDRSIYLGVNDPPPTNTTLRATGTLATGTIVFSTPSNILGTTGFKTLSPSLTGYSFIGNPYASPLDWSQVQLFNVAPTIYVFDPTISGTNGRGAYVAFNLLTGINNIISKVNNVVESGQAFFVKNMGLFPTITVREAYKTASASKAIFRTTNVVPARLSLQLLLPGQDTTNQAADGVGIYFGDNFENTLGDEDSYKYSNPDENLSIISNDSTLSIEGRKTINIADTVQLKISQMNPKTYQFKAVTNNFDPNVTPFLEDLYLQTITVLDNAGTTYVPFAITTDTASFSPKRFRIVFRNAGTLPLTFAGMKAYEKNKGVQVDWSVASETAMSKHEVERSGNAQQFTKLGEVKANNLPSSMYTFFDEQPLKGDNFYRIKSISTSGAVKYSPIAKVHINNKEDEITLLASEISTNTISLQLKNAPSGNYPVSLVNSGGQKVYAGSVQHSAGNVDMIKVKTQLAAGIYRIQVMIGDRTYSTAVLIK